MKRISRIIVYMILCGLLTFGVLTFALPGRSYSENENRVLQTRPALSLDALLDGSYQDNLTEFLSDQFPFRDSLMATATRLKLATGRRDIGDVYIGKDHYYFEKTPDEDIDVDNFKKNLARIESLSEEFPEIPVTVLLIPSAGNILTEKLPAYAEVFDADALYELAEGYFGGDTAEGAEEVGKESGGDTDGGEDEANKGTDRNAEENLNENSEENVEENIGGNMGGSMDENMGGNKEENNEEKKEEKAPCPVRLINPSSLLDAANHEDIYYRTDHHWTAKGAWVGYRALMGEDGNYKEYEAERVSTSFYGTLYSSTLDASAIPDTIELPVVENPIHVTIDGEEGSLYDMDALEEKDQYRVYLGGNHGLVEITGCGGTGTLLILKDSFANSLVPYLTEDYETIILIDLRYYGGSVRQYLRSHEVDEILVVAELSKFAADTTLAKLAL